MEIGYGQPIVESVDVTLKVYSTLMVGETPQCFENGIASSVCKPLFAATTVLAVESQTLHLAALMAALCLMPEA